MTDQTHERRVHATFGTRFIGVAVAVFLAACSSNTPPNTAAECRDDFGDDVEMAAETTGQAVETGAKAAWEGTKTAGKSAGALFDEGNEGARAEWEEGKERTDRVAHQEAADVRAEASVPRCPRD